MDSIRVVVFCRGSPRGYPTCSPASNLRASISRLSNHNCVPSFSAVEHSEVNANHTRTVHS